MLKATVQLSADLAHETDPISVLDALQHTVTARAGVQVLGAWRLAIPKKDDWAAYQLDRNVFYHPDVHSEFWPEYQALAYKYGPDPMFQKAWRNEGPFTFTEALRTEQPSGDDRWLVELHREHGHRDGFYCPCGRWELMLTSRTVLRTPSSETLAFLFSAAYMVTRQLEQIIDHRGLDRRERPSLSPREVAVLQHLGHGHSVAEIAHALGVDQSTIRTNMGRAQKKLGTRHYPHALCEALRLNLIS